MKFKTYKGENLTDVLVTAKIDGVRAHLIDGEIVSRAGKPLYNIPKIHEVCEVYLGSWEKTVSYVRTQGKEMLPPQVCYSLNPIDPRLIMHHENQLNADQVQHIMARAVKQGYEGLVLHSNGVMYKVKPIETYDVLVTGVIPGKGKHQGKVGALITPMGNVGTGFTDEKRTGEYVGKMIEVEAMSLTPAGKFRHPRFLRIRWDKDENIPNL